MILRRLSEHVAALNWTAVVLDFVIVVAGVFIGIQVSDWNAARMDRIDAGNVLEQLEQDFLQHLDRTERSLAAHAGNLAAAGRVIQGIRTAHFADQSLLGDLRVATSFSTPPGPSTTFQELVAGSRLRLIRSDELRRRLYEYNDYVSFVRSQYGYFSEPLNQARASLGRAITVVVTGVPSATISETHSIESVDQSMLLGDPEILASLQRVYGVQDNMHAVLLGNQKRIQDILGIIRTEQEKAQ